MDIKLTPPLCLCGFTPCGKKVIGGAFQLADRLGIPLWFSLDQAEEKGFVISFPHYFASAMEHGWDDEQAFSKIQEALSDRGQSNELERVKLGCMAMFMSIAKLMPERIAPEIGKRMRELLEHKP